MIPWQVPARAQPPIRIATEADYAPFEFTDATGQLTGFEIDLGTAICASAHLDCRFVNMDFDGTIPALQAHSVDAILSQMSVTDARARVVAFTDILTSSVAQFVAAKGAGITGDPASLRGRSVGVQSGTTHEVWARAHLAGIARLAVYQSQDQAFADLQSGRVDAVLCDKAIAYDWLRKSGDPRFGFVGDPLVDPAIFGRGTAIAVRRDDGALLAKLNAGIAAVEADGTYARINARYLPFSLAPADGGSALHETPDASAVAGMSAGWAVQLARGAALTLELAFVSAAFGLAGGLAGAAAKLSPRPWVRVPARWVINALRGVPEFVILLICYFGASRLLFHLTHGAAQVSPFAAGVFALSVVFAAYASENLRGAFVSVPRGQIEAARALGLAGRTIFWRIHLPQAWRLALPSLGNQWQSLLKDTSLVSVLGLAELMRRAQIGAQVTKQPLTFFLAASAIYLLFLGISNPAFAWLERRSRRGLA